MVPDAPDAGKRLRARLMSVAALGAALAGLGWLGTTVYRIATDSFVAPLVLSPDSDLVIQSKLSISQLLAEKTKITTKREELEAVLEASGQAIAELETLQESASKGLRFTSVITSKQASASGTDLKELERQRRTVADMIAHQEALVAQMKKDLDLGLVSKMDYSHEQQALNQLRLAGIENARAQLVSEVQMAQVSLTEKALKSESPSGIPTPEMLMQQDQLVRIKCDLLKLEAERRAALAQRRSIDEELAKIDELLAQLKTRPLFRATEAKTNVAFVPYTQIDGVGRGARIYDCLWGLVACKPVGRVSELLPGEVLLPDPWGTPTRGQYALIDLDEQRAAHSRTLRVRPGTSPRQQAGPGRSEVAAK